MLKIFSLLAIIALTGCAVYPVQPYNTVVQQPVVVSPSVVQQPVVVNPVPVYRPPVVHSRPYYDFRPLPYYSYSRPCCGSSIHGSVRYSSPNVSVGVRW